MHIHRPRVTPALLISCVALFAALSGTGYAASNYMTANNSTHLGWHSPNYYLAAHNITSSHGVHFLNAGETVVLGHAGPFTFTSTCLKDEADNQGRIRAGASQQHERQDGRRARESQQRDG
jgi:hypothetical protein